MTNLAFKPDGMYGDVPYRALKTGQIDVLLNGRIVRLNSVEQLVAIVSNDTALPSGTLSHNPNSTGGDPEISAPIAESSFDAQPPTPAAISLSKPRRGRKIVFWLIVIPVFLYFAIGFISGSGSVAGKVVDLLNSQYGGICNAKLEGWGSNTLKVDWTSRTTKLTSIQVVAAVSTAKSALYDGGVRYFKFPNDAGGYNVIDWKTGEKTSVSDRAPYHF